MRSSYGSRRAAVCGILLSGLVLAGCAGPSTRVIPRGEVVVREEAEHTPLLEAADPLILQGFLNLFSESSRMAGSTGESRAVRNLERAFRDYGYEAVQKPFEYEDGERTWSGINVEAVRKADTQDADILLIGTRHSTETDSPGSNESAAGMAACLEAARLLSKLPSDTELRFVSFSAQDSSASGALHYVDQLSEQEKDRIIGVVMLEALGHTAQDIIVLGTQDGKPVMAGDMLGEVSGNMLEAAWEYRMRPGGEISAFVQQKIPAVSVSQEWKGYEWGTPLDVPEHIETEQVARAVDVVCRMASEIMGTDSPSLKAKAHSYNDRDYAFVQRKETPSWFGETIDTVQAATGRIGEWMMINTDGQGDKVEKYQFRMRWLGMDSLVDTNYYFTEGRLDLIVPEMEAAGIEFEELKGRMEAVYGELAEEDLGPNGTQYDWLDPVHGKRFSLIPESERYDLHISEYTADRLLFEQRTLDGTVEARVNEDPRCDRLMELVQKCFPSDMGDRIGRVTFFTDGIGGLDCYLAPVETEMNGQEEEEQAPGGEHAVWELGLDLEDTLKADGTWRDRTATVKMLVGLSGQLLEASGEERYAKPYAEQFWPSETAPEGSGPERANQSGAPVIPGAAPGEEAREAEVSPDFVTAFQMFVLSGKPDAGPGNWKKEIRFFYGFEELGTYRNQVRQNLEMEAAYVGED